MQNIEKELPVVMNRLLQADLTDKRSIVERYFTADCRLTHALVIAENREEIISIYQFWKFINTFTSVIIHEIIINKDETKVAVQFTQKVENYMHGPSFNLPMCIIFFLCDTPQGKMIWKQVDYHSFEGILFTHPLFHPIMHFQRKMNTWLVVGGPNLVRRVWPQLETWLRSSFKVVDECWDGAVEVLSKFWWKKGHRFTGVSMAPYDPSL